jgi:hypothetical protein
VRDPARIARLKKKGIVSEIDAASNLMKKIRAREA